MARRAWTGSRRWAAPEESTVAETKEQHERKVERRDSRRQELEEQSARVRDQGFTGAELAKLKEFADKQNEPPES